MSAFRFSMLSLLVPMLYVPLANSMDLQTNQDYQSYQEKFDHLLDGERLEYVVQPSLIRGVRLVLLAKNSEGTLRSLAAWENVAYGSYQFSSDRKRAVFALDSNGPVKSYFVVDGRAGIASYLFDSPSNLRSSADLRWLLGYSRKDFPATRNHLFYLIDVSSKKIVRQITWDIGAREGGVVLIYRGPRNSQDFLIEYNVERVTCARGEFSAYDPGILTTLDNVLLPYDLEAPTATHSLQEIGQFEPLDQQ